MYPELRNRVQVMVGGMCVCLVSKTMNHVRGAISILFAKNGLSLFSVVAFIKFYKCGIWAFLGCQACFMCSGGVLY